MRTYLFTYSNVYDSISIVSVEICRQVYAKCMNERRGSTVTYHTLDCSQTYSIFISKIFIVNFASQTLGCFEFLKQLIGAIGAKQELSEPTVKTCTNNVIPGDRFASGSLDSISLIQKRRGNFNLLSLDVDDNHLSKDSALGMNG